MYYNYFVPKLEKLKISIQIYTTLINPIWLSLTKYVNLTPIECLIWPEDVAPGRISPLIFENTPGPTLEHFPKMTP